MAYEFKLNRRVEFSDTDMAGIMHYSNFFHFMEATEAAFFRSFGLSIVPSPTMKDKVGWPRVHVDCDFRQPLRFEDLVEIHLLVREIKERSIVYTFIFRKINGTSVQEVARGNIVAACVRHHPETGKMESTPIPVSITEKIELAPKELFD